MSMQISTRDRQRGLKRQWPVVKGSLGSLPDNNETPYPSLQCPPPTTYLLHFSLYVMNALAAYSALSAFPDQVKVNPWKKRSPVRRPGVLKESFLAHPASFSS